MQISEHYKPFDKKLVIVVTNNECARLLKAEGREIDEIEIINSPDLETTEREFTANGGGEPDFDAIKLERLKKLYTALGDRLRSMLEHEDYLEIKVCIPEINKNIFIEHLPADMTKKITQVIPKNLASMDIAHIVRILLEG